MTTVISVENLSKQYRLGTISTGTLSHDLNRWWAQIRGKPDPFLKVGQGNPVGSGQGTVGSDYIWALRDVSFEVKEGEVLGIIGRNGAGKSTLLKILSRVTAPTSGQIKVKGRIASLLEVGTGFHPELTGRENIYLNGAILGMSRAEIARKFDEIVAFAEVEQFIDTPVKRYSSGMYVRLAFAVAAHLEPEILVVDEVLAVGDAEFQQKCLGKMSDVARQGRTVLFVSHNMTAVENLCEKTIVLKQGAIDCIDDTDLAIAHYIHSGSNEPIIGKVDLRLHPGRRDGSQPIIREIRIVDGNNKEIGVVTVGSQVIFEIGLDPGTEKFKDCALGLGIVNMYNQLIVPFRTRIQCPEKWSLEKARNIKLIWEECAIAPGIYRVNLAFASGDDTIDWIDAALDLEVRIKGTYGVGQGGLDGGGVVVPRCFWQLEQ